MILLVYIDDCLLYATKKEEINGIIIQIKERVFQLKPEDNADIFLGVGLDRQDGGTIGLQ